MNSTHEFLVAGYTVKIYIQPDEEEYVPPVKFEIFNSLDSSELLAVGQTKNDSCMDIHFEKEMILHFCDVYELTKFQKLLSKLFWLPENRHNLEEYMKCLEGM